MTGNAEINRGQFNIQDNQYPCNGSSSTIFLIKTCVGAVITFRHKTSSSFRGHGNLDAVSHITKGDILGTWFTSRSIAFGLEGRPHDKFLISKLVVYLGPYWT